MDSVAAVVKSKIDVLLGEKDFVIVAIDGKCTSGKTTLASKLVAFAPSGIDLEDTTGGAVIVDLALRPGA